MMDVAKTLCTHTLYSNAIVCCVVQHMDALITTEGKETSSVRAPSRKFDDQSMSKLLNTQTQKNSNAACQCLFDLYKHAHTSKSKLEQIRANNCAAPITIAPFFVHVFLHQRRSNIYPPCVVAVRYWPTVMTESMPSTWAYRGLCVCVCLHYILIVRNRPQLLLSHNCDIYLINAERYGGSFRPENVWHFADDKNNQPTFDCLCGIFIPIETHLWFECTLAWENVLHPSIFATRMTQMIRRKTVVCDFRIKLSVTEIHNRRISSE